MRIDTDIHPFWFRQLSRHYETRAGIIAQEAADLRKVMGDGFSEAHSRLQRLEYGPMSNKDFDGRIQIARILSQLTFRWQRRGYLVTDIDDELPDCATPWLDIRRGPMFLDLRARNLTLASGSELIEGAYVEPTAGGEGVSSAVTFVTRQPNLRPESAALGALLTAQSMVAFGVAADPEHDNGVKILMSDAKLARDEALMAARSAVDAFMFRVYAHRSTYKRNDQARASRH